MITKKENYIMVEKCVIFGEKIDKKAIIKNSVTKKIYTND